MKMIPYKYKPRIGILSTQIGKSLSLGAELQWYHKTYLENRRYDSEFVEKEFGVKGTDPLSKDGPRVYFSYSVSERDSILPRQINQKGCEV